jgi:hypothetical protein
MNNEIKKYNHARYLYSRDESDNCMYVFEILLKNKFNETQVIRKIKQNYQGSLLTNDDNILYTMINVIKVTIIDVNNNNIPIIVKGIIDHKQSITTILNNTIYLEFRQNSNNFIESHYCIRNTE